MLHEAGEVIVETGFTVHGDDGSLKAILKCVSWDIGVSVLIYLY